MNGQMNLSDLMLRAFGPSGGGRTGALDLNQNPEAAGTMPPEQSGAYPKDVWDRLGAQLQFANQVATVGRGMYGDLTAARGPASSPLAARPGGGAAAFTPTARLQMTGPQAGGLRLSDLLARR